MVPRYLFLAFLLLVLVAGCSSNEPSSTLRAVSEPLASTSAPEVAPVEVVTETLVNGVVATDVPAGVVSAEALPVEELVELVDPVIPTVVSEVVSPETTEPQMPETVEPQMMKPELFSADDILGALILASDSVETGSYEMSITSDVKVEGLDMPVSMKIFGDYQEPDRQRVTAEVGVSFFKIQIEMVVIGNLVYVKDMFTGEWMVQEGESATEGFHDFLDVIQPSDLLGRLALGGDSLIDGRVVLHLEGEVPPEVLGEAGEGIESLWVRYSVGLDDGLLYGSEIRMTDDEGTVTTVTFRFFDHGKEVDIQAPEIAVEEPVSGFFIPGLV